MIDGSFDDWESIPTVATDPVDPQSVLCDFREVRATSDASGVFLFIRLQHRMRLKLSGGRVVLLIDSDGNPETGWSERSMAGVDVALEGHPGERSDTPDGHQRVGLRFWAPGATTPSDSRFESLTRVGLMRAPAFESDFVELRVPRGTVVPGLDAPLLSGKRAQMMIFAELPDGTRVDEVRPFSVDLEDFGPFERPDQELDPIARRPGTKLRVLEWNVSHRTLLAQEDRLTEILAALAPDVVLLNEVTSDFLAERVGRVLERARIVEAARLDQIVYGRGGGEERAVIAGRFPLRELSGLTDLHYPIYNLRKLRVLERVASTYAEQVEKGIQAAGAVVTIGERRILLTALGLKSGAYRAFQIEEDIRRFQSLAISSAIAQAAAESQIDGAIVAGDLNLVVTDRPLYTLAQGSKEGVAPLHIANPLQLNGRSNATWSNPQLAFAPGRLDFLMYSADAFELDRSFVFDSRDLAPKWLEHYGLDAETSSEASDHFPIVADFSW